MSAYHDKNLGKREKKLGLLLTSLVIQGLRLRLPFAEGAGLILGWGAKIHMPWGQKTKT